MAGMLPGLFTPQPRDLRAEQQDEENRLFRMAQDPFTAAAYTSYGAAKQAGQGLATAIGNGMGFDTRSPTQKNVAAIEAAKQQVSQMGFDPTDPKALDQFYMNVIKILQQNRLVAEAADVAREWRAAKTADQNLDLKTRDLARKQKADDQKARAADERNAIARERLGQSGPEALQLLNQLDDLDPLNPNDEYKRKAIMQRLNQLGGQNGVKFEQLGDRVIVTDMQGNPIRTDMVGEKPLSAKDQAKADQADQKNANAYRTAKTGMQQQYDAAVDLYNMPGFDAIFGRTGQFVGQEGVLGGAATFLSKDSTRAAYEKWKQITGATFLTGLAQLKQASPTGATGLGAVSNIEGEKVQAAGAALGRSQDPASARTQLRVYIQTLVTASNNIDEAAKAEGIAPIPLVQKALTGPQRGTQRGAQPTAAPQAPLTPPAVPAAPVASQPAPSAPAAPAAAPKSIEGWSLKRVR